MIWLRVLIQDNFTNGGLYIVLEAMGAPIHVPKLHPLSEEWAFLPESHGDLCLRAFFGMPTLEKLMSLEQPMGHDG